MMYKTNPSDENKSETRATVIHNPKCSAPVMRFPLARELTNS